MKVVEKVALVIYSYIILVIAVVTSLLIIGWLDKGLVANVINNVLYGNISSKIVLIINILLFVVSIICIFFGESFSKKGGKEKQGIILQNESGRLLISKETIENLTNSVVKKNSNIEESNSKVIVGIDNSIAIMINIVAKENVPIKELTVYIQQKVKEIIKNSLDIEVSEVNVRVKSVELKKENNKANNKEEKGVQN